MMKTTGRTNKMSKRFLALGLTLSLIFGMTLTAYASEEGEGGGTTPEVMAPARSEIVETIQEAEATAQEAYTPVNEGTPASGLMKNAEDPVYAVFTVYDRGEGLTVADAKQLLEGPKDADGKDGAERYVENAEASLEAAIIDVNSTNGVADQFFTDAAAAAAAIKTTNNDINTFNNSKDDTDKNVKRNDAVITNSDSAIKNAGIANSSQSKDEAYQAADNAHADLNKAETGLAKAQSDFEKADADCKMAEAALKKVEDDKKAADEQLKKLTKDLGDATTYSTNSLNQMKALQAKLRALNSNAAKLADQKEILETIRDQHYAMMVQYYNDVLKSNVVYDENGKLDIAANAAKITQKQIDNKSTNAGNPVMFVGRYLLENMAAYQLMKDEDLDLTSLEFTFGTKFTEEEKGNRETANVDEYEGIVFKDEKNHDQVVVNQEKTNNAGETVKVGEHKKIQRLNSGQGDAGRANSFKVTYKDKNRVTQTKYYNYIFKSSATNNQGETKTDLSNGLVYLALIEKNADGNQVWSRSTSENNTDDYAKLQEALAKLEEAGPDFQAYLSAKKAVDEATAKVADLNAQITALKNKYGYDTDKKLADLQKDLEKAQDNLAKAAEKKTAMEEKVEEARKAVAGINLNRFNVTPSTPGTDDGDETTGTTPDSPTIASITPGVIITPVFPAGAAATTVATGVAGAATGTPAAGIADLSEAELPGAATPELTELEDDLLPAAAEALTNLGDKDLPGAEGVEEGMNLWWIWLLILLLLIVAYLIYRDQQKKKEAQQNNNINPTV